MNPDTTLRGDLQQGIRVGCWRLASDDDTPDENDLWLDCCEVCGCRYVRSRDVDWMKCECGS